MADRFLRELIELGAEVLVAEHGLQATSIEVLAQHSFNTVLRAETGVGTFVVRIGDELRIHASGVEEAEAEWLAALHADTLIGAPVVRRTRRGCATASATHAGLAGERVVSVLTYLDGETLRDRVDRAPSEDEWVALGRVHAELHEHAAVLPSAVAVPAEVIADRAVYFGDATAILRYESEDGSLFREAVARVDAAIAGLWAAPPHPPHLLHGDLGPHNVLVDGAGSLHPIDFQDLLFGFEVQDVGITISDLGRSRPEAVTPYLRGYAERRALPELPPELVAAFAAGRSLNVMNLGLQLRRPGIEAFLDGHTERVRRWMVPGAGA